MKGVLGLLVFAFVIWWLFFGIYMFPPEIVETIRIWCGWILAGVLVLIIIFIIWLMHSLEDY